MQKSIVVVHSGGMDSSLCLKLALERFPIEEVLSLSFSYGQRHELAELKQAAKICFDWKVDHVEIPISSLRKLTRNALTHFEDEMTVDSSGTPTTLVMGRNGLMARLAAIHAESLGAKIISMGVIGVEASNSGYRDCSREYMDLMEKILQIDLNCAQFSIETPLVEMQKYETLELAQKLGVLEYLLEETISCYRGVRPMGCGQCPACELRNEGIFEYISRHGDIALSHTPSLFTWLKSL